MTLKEIVLSNEERITYRERAGGHKTVVLVHGNMTSSKHWDVLMDTLDPNYKLYAIDLRGFGGSSYHNRITRIKDFSDDLNECMKILQLVDFHLIGWSTGGAVCMQYVIDYPDTCDKLVLLASASTRGYPFYAANEDASPDLNRRLTTIDDIEQSGQNLLVQGMYDTNNREGLKAVWEATIYSHRKPDADQYEAYIDDMLTQRNLADVYHALNVFNSSDVENALGKGTGRAKEISIPVLVIKGDRDYVVTSQMTAEIMEDLGSHASLVVLEDTGHSALIDNVEKLREEIETFLQ